LSNDVLHVDVEHGRARCRRGIDQIRLHGHARRQWNLIPRHTHSTAPAIHQSQPTAIATRAKRLTKAGSVYAFRARALGMEQPD
jgi:hypothetical protein